MTDGRPSGDRTLTWWPIAGALIIALIGVAVIVFVGNGSQNRDGLLTDDNGALKCTPTYLQNPLTTTPAPRAWVPVKDDGDDGTDSLVPDKKPQQITICHYRASGTLAQARPTLLGRVTLKSGLEQMAKTLSKYPAASTASRSCTTPGDYYLVGFVISGAALWVAVPDNGCQNVTNGDFEVDANLRPLVISAYQTRSWG